jgi:metal transporter CNNM
MYIILALICVSFAALFSSLTIGLMSLDLSTLKRKIEHGDKDAEKVYRIRKNGMLLLTTLLLGNAAASSFFAILLGDMLHGVVAGMLSTILLFIFGEILPQAAVSRHALKFGAQTAPLIRFIMWFASPICYPIAWCLNKLLGEEGPTRYTKRDILSIIEDDADDLIGGGALAPISDDARKVDVALHILKPRQGIGSHCLERLLDIAFKEKGVEQVWGSSIIDHPGTPTLCAKHGMIIQNIDGMKYYFIGDVSKHQRSISEWNSRYSDGNRLSNRHSCTD